MCPESEYLFKESIIKALPRKHLAVQSQQEKHYKKVWNMFKVNNKDTKTTPKT